MSTIHFKFISRLLNFIPINALVTDGDRVDEAIAKLQGQITANLNSGPMVLGDQGSIVEAATKSYDLGLISESAINSTDLGPLYEEREVYIGIPESLPTMPAIIFEPRIVDGQTVYEFRVNVP